MTHADHREKPEAENRPVRLDRDAFTPVKPRRGPLLHRGVREICLLVLVGWAAVGEASSLRPVAAREARTDGEGVLRWTDDGSETILWGVNYYTPFAVDYASMKARGLDHKAEILRDLEHFDRLGLTSLRIHCFDRQFSGPNGEFVDNDHVEMLDYLITQAALKGIYTVLTPIAWWGGSCTDDKQGFSNRFTMPEMTTRREAWACQAKFLKAFGEHVNRHTGRRYAEDPAVVAFELINEPLYPPKTTDDLVVEYVNTLADGLRASGTQKPIFYNSWQGRNAALSRARVDGVTGSYYPTGLASGRTHVGPQLSNVKASLLNPLEQLVKRARMIYEFDAADTPGTYMYPALARLFRHEGVQIANMFQYDPLALAPYNKGWPTHYLNLVYTPGKALSFAIAAEGFRRWPMYCGYRPDRKELRYEPCRVNADEDLSELVTADAFLYTNDTGTRPPQPGSLTRVWGRGVSSTVASNGNGAYFLDRLGDGLWNLQVYPSVATVRDAYMGGDKLKTAVSMDAVRMTVHLPDLGVTYGVWANGRLAGRAKAGSMLLSPGEYILARAAWLPANWLPLRARSGIAAFIAPKGDGFWEPPPACARPEDWNFLDVGAQLNLLKSKARLERTKDEKGVAACKVWVPGGFTATKSSVALRVAASGEEILARFPDFCSEGRELVIHLRSVIPETSRIEVALIDSAGIPWGTVLPVTAEWRDVRLPLASLRYFRHWCGGSELPPGAKPDLGRMRQINFCLGSWLFGQTSGLEHGVEMSSVRIAEKK